MMTQSKPLSAELIADGLSQTQADILEQAFGTQPDFLAGMPAAG